MLVFIIIFDIAEFNPILIFDVIEWIIGVLSFQQVLKSILIKMVYSEIFEKSMCKFLGWFLLWHITIHVINSKLFLHSLHKFRYVYVTEVDALVPYINSNGRSWSGNHHYISTDLGVSFNGLQYQCNNSSFQWPMQRFGFNGSLLSFFVFKLKLNW